VVVLEGSIARKEIAESAKERHLKMRPTLIADGSLKDYSESSYVFTKDVVFSSPSNAAQNILARNANGWTEWKRESDGKTLDEVYRQT
jgi:predicted type IV restriction endonuclease